MAIVISMFVGNKAVQAAEDDSRQTVNASDTSAESQAYTMGKTDSVKYDVIFKPGYLHGPDCFYAGQTEKSGKYYFQVKNVDDSWGIYISTKKNSGYKLTPIPIDTFLSDGSQAFYIAGKSGSNNCYLYKYVYSSKKTIKLKKLSCPEKGYGYGSQFSFRVAAGYDNKIYINCLDYVYPFPSFDDTLKDYNSCYSYDLTTKKLVKVLDGGGQIVATSGKYVAIAWTNQYIANCSLSLGKITSSGIKTVKKLTKTVYNPAFAFIGNELYYSYNPSKGTSYNGNIVYIYKCNSDGSNKKKIATIKSSKSNGNGVGVQKVGKKACYYYDASTIGKVKYYKYTYATKKKTKISESTYLYITMKREAY
jgi:hypothetical protein